MTAKEFLRNIRYAEKKMEELRKQIDRKSDELTSIAAQYGHKTRGSTKRDNKMVDLNVAIADLRKMLIRIVERSIQDRREAVAIINRIQDDRYRMVLLHYYILGQDWQDVAKAMAYDIRWVYRLHGMALDSFEKARKEATKSHANL